MLPISPRKLHPLILEASSEQSSGWSSLLSAHFSGKGVEAILQFCIRNFVSKIDTYSLWFNVKSSWSALSAMPWNHARWPKSPIVMCLLRLNRRRCRQPTLVPSNDGGPSFVSKDTCRAAKSETPAAPVDAIGTPTSCALIVWVRIAISSVYIPCHRRPAWILQAAPEKSLRLWVHWGRLSLCPFAGTWCPFSRRTQALSSVSTVWPLVVSW